MIKVAVDIDTEKEQFMKHDSFDLKGSSSLIKRITHLPSYLLRNHDEKTLAHMLLYNLGHDDCFAFESGAYFIDNPEFDCLKGCAGFTRGECKIHPDQVWSSPSDHHDHLYNAPFNKKVQEMLYPSIAAHSGDIEKSDTYKNLCEKLCIANPDCISWPMKHGNKGVLIFNHNNAIDDQQRSLLINAASLLGFCPVG